MNIRELRQKNKTALARELATKRDQLRELKFKLAKDETKNIRESRNLKKDIARILTVLREGNFQTSSEVKPRPLDTRSK